MKTRSSAWLSVQRPLLGAALACVTVGCAEDRAMMSAHEHGEARSEAVFLPAVTDESLAGVSPSDIWWDGRRDGEMNARYDGPILATSQWPQPERPDVNRYRYIPLPRRAETYLYFQPEQSQWRHPSW